MTRALSAIIFLVLLAMMSMAQMSNLVVFTQTGEPFTLIMNGIQQSPDPETNVKVTGLNAPNYKVKVLFSNSAISPIDKTIYLQPEVEVTYEILKNKKGAWVMRMLNSTPIDEVSEPTGVQQVFIFTTTPRINTTTVSQTTTISTGGLLGGASVTTTTTQTSTGVTSHEPHDDYEGHEYPDYNGPKGCHRPMSDRSFSEALESINSKSFETSKLTIAKQIAGANCLLCRQVKEIMKQFTFESNRLEFAKYAYKYTWDIKNYYQLNDAFEFESSIEELNRFIN